MKPFAISIFSLIIPAVLMVACAQSTSVTGSQSAPASSDPRVFFIEPVDQAETSSPVTVKFGAANFTVEATGGEIKPNHGHLHIMVDADCIAMGQGIPKDEAHLHYGQGQMEAQLELPSGEHTLCLQAADGNHIALAGAGMTHKIKVAVK